MGIKKILLFLIVLVGNMFFLFGNISVSDNNNLGGDPVDLLNGMKSDVQETKLDDVNNNNSGITGVLTYIKENSGGYIKWLGFIGLSIALILIVYNGIYLIANFSDENKLSKIKKRFMSLIMGVIILTVGYLIIKFVVLIVGEFF